MFANGPGDLGSIPGRVIPKTPKMVLDAILLNTQHYKVLSRVKWSNPGKGVAPSPKLRCSSYRKGSLRVTLDYGRQLYLHLNCELILNWIIWNRTLFIKMDLALNNQQRLICYKTNHPTGPDDAGHPRSKFQGRVSIWTEEWITLSNYEKCHLK